MTVDDAHQWRAQGLAALQIGDRAGARAALTAAVQRDPQDAVAWYALGTLQHDPQRALAAFERTLALDPSHAAAQAAAAQVRRYLGQTAPVTATPAPTTPSIPAAAQLNPPPAAVITPAAVAGQPGPAPAPFAPMIAPALAAPPMSAPRAPLAAPAPAPFASRVADAATAPTVFAADPRPPAAPLTPIPATQRLNDLAQQGIAAAQAGWRAEAREALLQVVATDESYEAAWYWLSTVVDDPADVEVALENTLHLNPQHTAAAARLRELRGQPATTIPVVLPSVAIVVPTAAPVALPVVPAAPAPPVLPNPTAAPIMRPTPVPPVPLNTTSSAAPVTDMRPIAAPPNTTSPAAPATDLAVGGELLPATDPEDYRPLIGQIMAKRYLVLAPFPSGGLMVLLASDVKNGSYLLIRADTEVPGKPSGMVAKRGFVHNGRSYVVSNIGLNGLSLRTFLDAVGRLPAAQAVQYGLQLIRIARRGRGLLLERRTWRPESITITADGALDLTALPGMDEERPAPSSLSPPEHHAGRPLDARSDVYLIGALIYYLLTASAPPEAMPLPHPETPADRRAAPRLVAEFPAAPGMPLRVAGVLAKALQADPAARYPTLAAFEAALQELAADLRQEEASRRIRQSLLPRLIAAALWVGAFISAMLILGFILTNRDDPLKALRLRFMPPPPPTAGSGVTTGLPDTGPAPVGSALQRMAIFAPGGRNSLNHLSITQVDSSRSPMTTVYFSAVSNDYKPVSDLQARDFTVLSDTVPITNFQVVNLWSITSTVSIYLVMDTSASMAGAPLAAAQKAARQFVSLFGPADQFGLIRFNDHTDLLQQATADKTAVLTKIAGLDAFGNTALYDAIHQAVDYAARTDGRHLVVVLSDGKDTASSSFGRADVISYAQEHSIPIYVIGLTGSEDYDGATLTALAQAGGGELLESPDPEQLAGLYQLIAFQVAGSYRLTFTGTGGAGSHTIKITTTSGDQPYSGKAGYTLK